LHSTVNTLHATANAVHPAAAGGMGDAITNIVVAGLRSLPTADLRRSSPLKTYHLARAKTYVLDHLRDPHLSALSVAAALRMTPDHLHRLFREEPVSVAELIWQSRLEACRRDLADATLYGRSVSAIAFSWGFNDAAHFSRSFRGRFGLSPREWRSQSSSYRTS
jgi:AraC-like DNA-binding protein